MLDIGCGFADLLGYLSDEPSRKPAQYTGVDINQQLLDVGAQHFPDATFIQANILLDDDIPDADVVFMLGVLNFRFQDFDNLDFAHAMISRAFGMARETLVVDLLSQCRDEAYPEEDFVYYYDPAQILRFALSLTPHVELRHDYPSIPQREMMLVMRHAPWTS